MNLQMSYSQEPLEELREYLARMKSSLANFSSNEELVWYVEPVINSLSETIRQIDEDIGEAPRIFRKER
jgi:hypothetical protein